MQSQINISERDKACSTRFSTLGAVWKNRPDSEHKQAILRLILGTIILFYLLNVTFKDGSHAQNYQYILLTAAQFFSFSFIILIWLVINPGVSVVRRVLGIFVDIGTTTVVLFFHGILSAPVFVVYLWVTFGNGFRFGQKYLALSAACSVIGFLVVTLFSDYKEVDSHFTMGLLVGLVVLPLYVASLLRQLNRTLELAESANRAKSNFLATMSHEIRTPLNGMVGITELLGNTQLDEKQRHYIRLISHSSEWLMRVITDGLDFSKIEAGEFLLMQDRFDLQGSLENLCLFYSGLQESSEIDFVYTLSPKLSRNVVGDQLRLAQVLGNLLSNAFKFTETGTVSLKAELLNEDTQGVRVQFVVSDTGPGIPKEKQKLIFEPFQQAESGTTKKYGGTGLGLAIADRLVSLMGGKLRLSSTVGKGSSFIFSVYFSIPSNGETEMENRDVAAGQLQWRRSPKLLLVEDHEINREVVVGQLENMGCQVTLAVTGLEAVAQVRGQLFDVILMDCQMPEMDGYEATRQIRVTELQSERGDRVPIIALTAHVTVEDKRKCLECGMDDYLGKPFRTEDLRSKLNKWLAPLLVESAQVPISMAVPALQDEVLTQKRSKDERKMFHDLKNVLCAIQGSAELCLLEQKNQNAHIEHTKRIHDAVLKAARIVENLSEKSTDE